MGIKQIQIPAENGKTIQISTPWLSSKEACLYLDISPETFRRLNKILPCPHSGGAKKTYLARVLDEWWVSLENFRHEKGKE